MAGKRLAFLRPHTTWGRSTLAQDVPNLVELPLLGFSRTLSKQQASSGEAFRDLAVSSNGAIRIPNESPMFRGFYPP
ncbi:hypothetical protein MUO14_04900 [Halobacillus shinanisalinarum]|uniref:Uncharacterized protein n=1 Tax=Halobacillus shinanisalinarum TaxID=2932258 RepID=A0ABY4H1I8_9BACI|nr:hypothetical protein [Halobacillus shinanisalinarum]UOQ94303.1 hypothetical protein MUO14_04900 [Halobacillus shinanisalinarum]